LGVEAVWATVCERGTETQAVSAREERGARAAGPDRSPSIAVAVLAVCVAVLAAAPAGAHDTTGKSTLEQTIVPVGGEGFQFLQLGPGEPYVVRTDLASGNARRADRRTSLIYFGQITDFQLPDEESPAREERFDADPFGRAAASGYRPQEPLTIHQIEATVRQMNLFLDSPVPQGDGSRARMANAVMTGDLADSMQRNETDWVLRLLEGGPINPGSGTRDLSGTYCEGLPSPETAISDFDDPSRYTGVGDYDDYATDSFLYYDPESLAGVYATDGWPTYSNLFDRAQVPFAAQGLGAPTYVVFGNHDALYQGTVSAGPGLVTPGAVTFEDMALNCLKPVYPLANEQTAGPPPDPADLVAGLATGKTTLVPPDQGRQYVDKHQFKDIFRQSSPTDDDHGFAHIDPAETAASNDQASYYSFHPKPGLRFIVLDSVSESGILVTPGKEGPVGGQEGNIDHPQWLWLEEELDEAQGANELVALFAHHNIKTLTQQTPDEVSPCSGVERFGHDRFNPSCDRDPRPSTPIHDGEDLRDLLLAHPNAIALVAGHTHENLIQPFDDGAGGGGFWEITSPAIADWPPQHRVIDVMDNRDGTLSLFTTMLDHDSPSTSPPSGTDASGFGVGELASVGRTITYNDPQEGPGDEGAPIDRNAELLIANPRCATVVPGAKPPKGCKAPGKK
jgi:metallophosphoesterase (TIGR03767 family)